MCKNEKCEARDLFKDYTDKQRELIENDLSGQPPVAVRNTDDTHHTSVNVHSLLKVKFKSL